MGHHTDESAHVGVWLSRRGFLATAASLGALLSLGCNKEAGPVTELDPKRLRDALDGIKKWLSQNNPETANALQPGLSTHEIEKLTEQMPIALTDELFLLYQWHNGTSKDAPFIWNHHFPPLQTVVRFWSKSLESTWQPSWFPIFLNRGDAYLVAAFGYKAKMLPIRHFAPQSSSCPNAFANLTTMMETALEWYTSGAVKSNGRGGLRADTDLVRVIFQKHNPEQQYPGDPIEE